MNNLYLKTLEHWTRNWRDFNRAVKKLDRGAIRSNPRYGWSTPYRLTMTIRNSARLFHLYHVLFNMGDLHLVLPALNLSTLNAGISLLMQQVRLMTLDFWQLLTSYDNSWQLMTTYDNFWHWAIVRSVNWAAPKTLLQGLLFWKY